MKDGYTVGQLLKWIKDHNIPMDTKIVYQRIEDIYFERNGWTTIKKEGYHYRNAVKHNEKVDSGEYDDKENYPNITEATKFTLDELEKMKEEYIAMFSPVFYDTEYLYLDAHY